MKMDNRLKRHKMKQITIRRSDEADSMNLSRFLPQTQFDVSQSSISCTKFFCSILETFGAQSPKDFNMDNPLQAEGAARGIGSSNNNERLMDCFAAFANASSTESMTDSVVSLAPHFQCSIFNFQFDKFRQ
jgi:hypothetical protein